VQRGGVLRPDLVHFFLGDLRLHGHGIQRLRIVLKTL
jgi:hypothetical protein